MNVIKNMVASLLELSTGSAVTTALQLGTFQLYGKSVYKGLSQGNFDAEGEYCIYGPYNYYKEVDVCKGTHM